ncbi:MAG TPA: DNA-binding domain-containing protein [Burkholderiaceae bacterium]|nr:DNA-binding domain-containing protein [Burkholderiaceae bacterium]
MSAQSSLRALQTNFGAALHHAAEVERVLPRLSGDAASNAYRLAIYRANAIAACTRALRAHYPVCARLVGDEFFDATARAYRQAHPSTNGDLGHYGDAFAEFLRTFEHARSLPYLSDVAQLEWAVHIATTAADRPDAPITREPALLFMPGSCVLAFAHAAADIWLAHQPNSTIALDAIEMRAQGAIVYRDGFEVKATALPYDEARALIEWMAAEHDAA